MTAAERNRLYRLRHPERVRAANRARMKGRTRNTTKESRQRWYDNNPDKVRAIFKLNGAIRAGKMIRPLECEDCGRAAGSNQRGHSLIHAHHDDYSRPFDVRWLCVDCHKCLHRIEVRDGAAEAAA